MGFIKFKLALISAIILTTLSLFMNIVPCKQMPAQLAVTFEWGAFWGFCKLIPEMGLMNSFFGLTFNSVLASILTFIAWFIIFFLLSSIFIRKKKR